jgi:hypothetical protein
LFGCVQETARYGGLREVYAVLVLVIVIPPALLFVLATLLT